MSISLPALAAFAAAGCDIIPFTPRRMGERAHPGASGEVGGSKPAAGLVEILEDRQRLGEGPIVDLEHRHQALPVRRKVRGGALRAFVSSSGTACHASPASPEADSHAVGGRGPPVSWSIVVMLVSVAGGSDQLPERGVELAGERAEVGDELLLEGVVDRADGRFSPIDVPCWKTAPNLLANVTSLGQYRWDPIRCPSRTRPGSAGCGRSPRPATSTSSAAWRPTSISSPARWRTRISTWNGREPVALDGGATRTFLEDGDRLTIRGQAKGDGYRIGFGDCTGVLLPAADLPDWAA